LNLEKSEGEAGSVYLPCQTCVNGTVGLKL